MAKLPVYNADEILTAPDDRGIIGQGSYGSVRYCKNVKLGRFAVKCLPIIDTPENLEAKRERIFAEAQILHQMSHPNIIQVHGITTWRNTLGILTEYLSCGNLAGLLRAPSLTNLPWPLRLRIAVELSQAICYLHNYRSHIALVHGDIKPENILLTDDLRAKLGDFGSVCIAVCTGASTMTTNAPNTTQHTPLYTAPEFLKDFTLLRSPAMDVYSFGMVMYELLTRMRVYQNASVAIRTLLQVICDMGQRPDVRPLDGIKDDLCPIDLEILSTLEREMKQSWSQNPKARPQIHEVRDRLLVQLHKINQGTITQIAGSVIEQMDIKCMDFDSSCSATLECFSFPYQRAQAISSTTSNTITFSTTSNTITFSTTSAESASRDSGVPPSSFSSISHRQEEQHSIPQVIENIKSFLESNHVSEAVDEADRLVTLPTSKFSGDYDVIAIAEMFKEKSEFVTSLSITQWGISLFDKSTSPTAKLDKLNDCCFAVNGVTDSMNAAGMCEVIKERSLPLLRKLHNKIKLVQTGEEKYKTKVELCCLYFIGCCYCYIGRFEQANEMSRIGKSQMICVFGSDSKRHQVFACFHYLAALANHHLENHAKSKEQFKKAIKLCKKADDASEADMIKLVGTMKVDLNRSNNPQRSSLPKLLSCFNFK